MPQPQPYIVQRNGQGRPTLTFTLHGHQTITRHLTVTDPAADVRDLMRQIAQGLTPAAQPELATGTIVKGRDVIATWVTVEVEGEPEEPVVVFEFSDYRNLFGDDLDTAVILVAEDGVEEL